MLKYAIAAAVAGLFTITPAFADEMMKCDDANMMKMDMMVKEANDPMMKNADGNGHERNDHGDGCQEGQQDGRVRNAPEQGRHGTQEAIASKKTGADCQRPFEFLP